MQSMARRTPPRDEVALTPDTSALETVRDAPEEREHGSRAAPTPWWLRVAAGMAALLLCVLFAIRLTAAVQREREEALFYAVADVHAADDYVAGSDPRTFCTAGNGAAGRVGFFNCDPPAHTPHSLLKSLHYMVSTTGPAPPRFVVYLGDSSTLFAEHPQPASSPRTEPDEARAEAANFAFVAQTLSQSFPVPVYPSLGNHGACSSQLPPHKKTQLCN